MAVARILNTDERTTDLYDKNKILTRDVERLEDALTYYENKADAEASSTRVLSRKEMDGTRWQYGTSGELHDFRTTADRHDEPDKEYLGQNSVKSKIVRSSRSSSELKSGNPDHKRLSEPLKCLKRRATRRTNEEALKPMTLSELKKSEHLTTTSLLSFSASPKQQKICDPHVQRWLQGLNLKDTNRYVTLFAENEFDMLGLKLISDAQLKEMGIKALGARNKILQGVKLIIGEEIVSKDLSIEPAVKKRTKTKMKKETKEKNDFDTIPAIARTSNRSQSAKVTKPASVSGKSISRPMTARPLSTVRSTTTTTSRPIGNNRKKPTGTVAEKMTKTKPRDIKELSPPQRTVIQTSGDDATRPLLEYEEPVTAISSYGEGDTAEKYNIIASLGAQVQKLLESQQNGDSKTIEMIIKLKEQISALGLQMQQKPIASKPSTETLKIEVKETNDDDRQPKPASHNVKLLNDLTQLTRLDETRRQKNAYATQISRLEMELGRLRGMSQHRCELPLEDLYYNEKDLIGEGVFSKVYRGQFQGVEVAVKRLKSPLNQQDKNYFAAEVALLRELRHPLVVLLLGVTTSTRLPCMVFEFMGAGSLYQILHEPNTPPLDHVAYYQLAKDMAQGMNYLHRHKPTVLHLDLKSKNVQLNAYGRAKIGDFGFSKLRHEASINAANRRASTSSDPVVTSAPSWMAPELLNAKPVTAKADVFSYAIILWEMLTRKEPYEGLSTYKVIEMVRQCQRPAIPDSTPPRLSMLISHCWDQNHAKRPSFKDILVTLEDLELPLEWRALLAKAQIPKLFLENCQSARQIIDYVNLSLESTNTGSDGPVPQISLTLDDLTDEEFIEISESERLNIAETERNEGPSVKLEFLNAPVASTENEKQTRDTEKSSSTEKFSEEEQVEISDRKFTSLEKCGSILPPGLMNRHFTDLTSVSDDERLEAVAPLLPRPLPNKGVPPHSPPFLNVVPPPSPPGCSMGPARMPRKPLLPTEKAVKPVVEIPTFNLRSDPLVTSARLQQQKSILRSSLTPHPAQLRSLKNVSKQRLSNVAEILKQAIEERRFALRDSIIACSDEYLSEPEDWRRHCNLAPSYIELDPRPGSHKDSRLDVETPNILRLSDAAEDKTRQIMIQSALDKLHLEGDEAKRSSVDFEAWGTDSKCQTTPRLETNESYERLATATPTYVEEPNRPPDVV